MKGTNAWAGSVGDGLARPRGERLSDLRGTEGEDYVRPA